MADDTAALVVRLEATVRQFQRQMDQAKTIADRSSRDIEKRFNAINPAFTGISTSLKGLGIALAGAFGAREIQQAADGFTKVQNALKVAGLEGEKLRATYEQLFAISQRQGTAIESTATLYGRLAATQKELGATQSDLLVFTEGVGTALRVAGTDAAAASGALLQLGQALGGGKIQAEEYNSILDGARPILQAVAAGLTEAGGSVAKLTALVKDGQVSSQAFFRAFLAGLPEINKQAQTAGTTSSQAIERLKNSFVNLVGQLNEITNASGAFATGVGGIATALDFVAQSAIRAANAVKELSNVRIEVPTQPAADRRSGGDARGRFGTSFNLDAESRRGLGFQGLQPPTREASPLGRPEFISAGEKAADAFNLGFRKVSLKDNPVVEVAKKATGGGGSSAATQNDYQRQIEQIQRRTAALEQEATTIGKSAFEADRAKASFDLMEAAKRAGLQNTPALTAEVERLSLAYAQSEETIRAAEEAQRQMNELARFAGDSLSNFFSDIVSGGENAQKALMNLVKRLADAALQAALLGDGPLGGLLGTRGANGAVGGILGALFSGFRANGGPVSGGRSYVVGERGPELFVPKRAGMIVPNDMMRAGGGSQVVSAPVTYHIDARGAQAGVADQITAALKAYDRTASARQRERQLRFE